ncbi:MAG: enoyl-[acyl-carrier-protein] reductase FabL [Thermoanaerobaculia bacterium]
MGAEIDAGSGLPANPPGGGLPLGGKTALVTGGSRGIGRAIVRRLAAAGCDLAINYYNSHDLAEDAAREVRDLGRRAVLVPGNVGDPSSVEEVFLALGKEFPRLDFLISNAASGVLRPAAELTLKHWRWCLETNALALNLLAQRAAPLMPPGGRIVALSSLGAERALPDYAFIGASKAALEALVRSLAVELAPRGLRVNAVSAGVVDTEALEHFPRRERIAGEFRRRSVAGRLLAPEDVAGVVYLLLLPEAEMVCGQTLRVDAGYSIIG